MKIKDILKIESNRQDDEFYLIHLFKDGGWWSAYELSAFLCHHYKNNLSQKLKINKKHLKSENVDFIKTGLKDISFDKYLPQNHEHIVLIEDNHIIINAKDFIPYEINHTNVDAILNNTKDSLVEKKNLTQPKHIINNSTTNITLLSILNDILTYNTDNVTYEEVISFLK